MDNLERLAWEYVNRRIIVPVRPHRPTVADRIRRLNPDGVLEGDTARGWHPSQSELCRMTFERGFKPLGAVLRRHGRKILDRITPSEIVKCGRRKYVSQQVLMELGA